MLDHRSQRTTWLALGLAALTGEVVRDGPLARLEQRLPPRRATSAGLWLQITRLGDRPALMVMTAAAASVARARHRSATRTVLPIVLGVPCRALLVGAVGRSRPSPDRWLVSPQGSSYPSRHATACALGVLALRRALPPSLSVSTAATATIILVGHSRVRLGVHWPTDVIGGIWLAVLLDHVCAIQPEVTRH